MDWLSPVRDAADRHRAPVAVFFRDDDGGWDDPALSALLECFSATGVPVDVAVIPMACSAQTREALGPHLASTGGIGRVHLHGYAHRNHESEGRRCEFGPSRDAYAVHREMEEGVGFMRTAFGADFDAVFTPPWNRCDARWLASMRAAGLDALSRDATATPFGVAGMQELPIRVDWLRERGGRRLAMGAIGEWIADEIARGAPTGVMLHHAKMQSKERSELGRLLELVAAHPMLRPVHMGTLVRERNR